MKNALWVSLIIIFFINGITVIDATGQEIIYVDLTATGSSNGLSWDDAYISLQDGIEDAQLGSEIWVAAGTYYPDQGENATLGDQEASFMLKNGVSIFGGFNGSETSIQDRNILENITILSGDLLQNDSNNIELEDPTRSDNSYHVVKGFNLRDLVVLDGLTITGGNASGNRKGGGIFIEQIPVSDIPNGNYLFSNLIIEKNAAINGGGIYLDSSGKRSIAGDITFRKVTIQHNYATYGGGGINSFYSAIFLDHVNLINNYASSGAGLDGASSRILWKFGVAAGNIARDWGGAIHLSGEHDSQLDGANLIFTGNSTEISWGGAIILDESLMNLTNSVFSGNNSATDGGAIVALSSKAKLTQCTFGYNLAQAKGGAIYNEGGDFVGNYSIQSNNSIFWGNTSNEAGDTFFNVSFGVNESLTQLNFSIVEPGLEAGVIDGGGNLFENPLFADPDGPDNVQGTADDDLRIVTSSPAIDSGNNLLVSSDTLDMDNDLNFLEETPIDLENNSRVYSETGLSIVDIGAYEFNAPPFSTPVEVEHVLTNDFELQVFPNPFAHHSTIQILVPGKRQGNISLSLYDALGRKILDLYQGGIASSSVIELTIPGYLKSGVYFLRGVLGKQSFVKQVVITN